MPPRLLRLTRLGAPLAACACLAAHADQAAPSTAAPPPPAAATARMPTVRLLMPRRAGDPILMIDDNGIARELPKQTSAAPARPAAPAPAPAAPPAIAPAPPAPQVIVATPPVPKRSSSDAPKAARLGDLSEDQRRSLAAMPLPQLPVLAAPDATAPAAPAAASATNAPGSVGDVETMAGQLELANDRIGLGEAQLAKIQAAKKLAASGHESAALAALIGLNHELDAATTLYVVKHGEALRQIAARPEVYGNANLWPLIQDANRAALPDPTHLREGQKLRVPRYPSAGAAAQAIEQARAAGP